MFDAFVLFYNRKIFNKNFYIKCKKKVIIDIFGKEMYKNLMQK